VRFYNLVLTDPKTGQIATRQGGAGKGTPFIWGTNASSGNAFDPGALDIEFDIPVSNYAEPSGGAGLTLYGVELQDLLQAYQFAGTAPGAGLIATLSGGMSAGLPLTNPRQAGVLVQGVVQQSFGNWIDTTQTLDFVLAASSFTPDNPGNLTITWRANTPLSQALQTTLSTAYPGTKINMAISPQLVLTHDEVGYYNTLEALAQAIQNVTQNQLSDNYAGVSIAFQGGQLYVYDGTVTPTAPPVQIQFVDLIGQPVWIGVNQMQFTTVMRGDLTISSLIKMPEYLTKVNGKIVNLGGLPGTVITGAGAALEGAKNRATFQGTFAIQKIRHIGRLRAADGQSWITVFNCAPYSGPAPTSPTN
jgi:hypothetical protein